MQSENKYTEVWRNFMRKIRKYNAEKYKNEDYTEVEKNIYQKSGESFYRTSISFIQEPSNGEGRYPRHISQYPLEDLLDLFSCFISDFYEKENVISDTTCYLEFASQKLENIKKVVALDGKHVFYNRGDDLVIEVEKV